MKAPFFDTSVLVGGLLEVGASWQAARRLLRRAADGHLGAPKTAWHCVLELYSVSTRLPIEYRVTPAEALRLVEESIVPAMQVVELPRRRHAAFLRAVVADRITGGRVYDAHIGAVAREAGCDVVITENVKHFAFLARDGVRVASPAEIDPG